MKNLFKILSILIIVTLSTISCGTDGGENPDNDKFTKTQFEVFTTNGVYSEGKALFSHDKLIQQSYQNSDMTKFYLTDLTGGNNLKLDFAATPNSTTETAVTVTTKDGSGTLNVVITKTTDEKIWLWDETNASGIIIPVNPTL